MLEQRQADNRHSQDLGTSAPLSCEYELFRTKRDLCYSSHVYV